MNISMVCYSFARSSWSMVGASTPILLDCRRLAMSSLAKGRSPGLSLVELRWREKLAPNNDRFTASPGSKSWGAAPRTDPNMMFRSRTAQTTFLAVGSALALITVTVGDRVYAEGHLDASYTI